MKGSLIISYHLNRSGDRDREGHAPHTWKQKLHGGNSQGLGGALKVGKEGQPRP